MDGRAAAGAGLERAGEILEGREASQLLNCFSPYNRSDKTWFYLNALWTNCFSSHCPHNTSTQL